MLRRLGFGASCLALLAVGCVCVSVTGCSDESIEEKKTAPAPAVPPQASDPQKEIDAIRAGAVETDLHGLPTVAMGSLAQLGSSPSRETILAYAQRILPAWHLASGSTKETLAIRNVETDASDGGGGALHVRVAERIHDRRVVGGELIVHVDGAGEVFMVNGRIVASRWADRDDLSKDPKIPSSVALGLAMAAAEIPVDKITATTTPELVYFIDTDNEELPHLAWAQEIAYDEVDSRKEVRTRRDEIFASADDAVLLGRHPKSHEALFRDIYTASNGSSITPLFQEGGTTQDAIARAAYDNIGRTYSFFQTKLGRDSYDNAGAGVPIKAVVHYGNRYNNAFFNTISGGSFLVFGDGDGVVFGPFATSLDVVAHEYTHAVTNYTAALVYLNDAGAINEALSDIMGAAAEAHALGGGTPSARTWKLGEDVFTPAVAGDALRYMNSPTLDGVSCDYYLDCAKPFPPEDNGGVHTRSGIANLAFYLLVNGGKHPRGKTPTIDVPAIGIDDATKIFYKALTSYMTSSTDYFAIRLATFQAALRLYPGTQRSIDLAMATVKAWNAVGVPTSGSTARQNGATTSTPVMPVMGSNNSYGGWVKFKLTVPYETFGRPQWLDIDSWPTNGGSARYSLYVDINKAPTTTTFVAQGAPGPTKHIRFDNAVPGDYFIWLFSSEGTQPVSLRATYGIDVGTEAAEPNDGVNQAVPFPAALSNAIIPNEAGRAMSGKIGHAGDTDSFLITIPPGKMLGIDLRMPAGKDYDVTLRNHVTGAPLLGTGAAIRINGGVEHATYRNIAATPLVARVSVSGYAGAFSTTEPYRVTANLLH